MNPLAQNGDSLVNLFHQGTKLVYKKGEFIIRPGESPSSIYYIESGMVKAYSITKYGEENLLIIRKSEEIFPLIWAMTGQERSIIYEAISEVTVWRSDRKMLGKLIESEPEVLRPLLDMTMEMYRIHSERIINLQYRSVRERLVSFLITMKSRFGKESKEGLVLDVTLRQQDIASSINASRETTSRELSHLEKAGLIGYKSGLIVLKDIKKLKSFL